MVPARRPAALRLASRLLAAVLLPALLLATGCGWGEGADGERLPWTVLRDEDHLRSELEAARRAGRPVLVEMSAAWCPPCRELERHLGGSADLRARLARCVLLRIDTTDGDRPDLRRALGLAPGFPQMVFFGKDGQRLQDLRLLGWDPREGPSILERALDRVG